MENISRDELSVMTRYLTIPDIMIFSLVSTKFSKYYKKCFENNNYEVYLRFNFGREVVNKSWWIDNYLLVKDLNNYEDFKQITFKISKNQDTVILSKKIINNLLILNNATSIRLEKMKVIYLIFNVLYLNTLFLKLEHNFFITVFKKAIEFFHEKEAKELSIQMIQFLIQLDIDDELKKKFCDEIINHLYTLKYNLDKKIFINVMDYYIDNRFSVNIHSFENYELNRTFTFVDIINILSNKGKFVREICQKILYNKKYLKEQFDDDTYITLLDFFIKNERIYNNLDDSDEATESEVDEEEID